MLFSNCNDNWTLYKIFYKSFIVKLLGDAVKHKIRNCSKTFEYARIEQEEKKQNVHSEAI